MGLIICPTPQNMSEISVRFTLYLINSYIKLSPSIRITSFKAIFHYFFTNFLQENHYGYQAQTS
jgi:hypothetical protein